MKTKCVLLITTVFLVLAVVRASEAVNTREIDRVREKGILDGSDLKVIDEFIADAVEEIVKARDFTGVGGVRTAISSRAVSITPSAAAQYKEQFSESSYKHISASLKEAEKLSPTERRFKAMVNLLILADSLENLRLAGLALGMLNDENTVIRYWAVRCVTNPGIIKRLNADMTANSKLAENIIEQLKNLLKTANPEMINPIAVFAAEVKIPQAEDLLLAVADVRIKRCVEWNVDYATTDTDVLKVLCGKLLSGSANRSELARRFAQLYSYAIQRYIRGQDFLKAAEKEQLASVLVETEQSCIVKLLDIPQSVIQKAVEQNDLTALMLEHNRLLGDQTAAGKVVLKLDFDYGKTSDGSKLLAPLTLPEPPAK